MTLYIGKVWHAINDVLTTINIFLLGLISFGSTFYVDKEKRDKVRIPLIANIILLIVLVVVMIAMYRLYVNPPDSGSDFTV